MRTSQIQASQVFSESAQILQIHSYVHQASQIHSRAHQASQIHSESAQILRVCSDIDVVQPLVHIANPSIASTQRVSSNVTNTQLRTSSIAIHRSAHQASQRHSESAQRLRVYSDIAVVQLLAHIANPSIANTQRVSSNVASTQLHTARIANTEVHIKHPQNTASQLKDCECTAILL